MPPPAPGAGNWESRAKAAARCFCHGLYGGSLGAFEEPPPRVGQDYSVDVDGRFEIPGVLPGSYALDIWRGDKLLRTETVTVGREDVALSLVVGR